MIKVKGASYASIPNALQASVTITLGRDSLNQPTGQITLPWASVNNHKLTLSYQPASAEDEATLQSYLPEGEITDISQLPNSLPGYLINVIPQLKLNGDIISQGQALALGQELNLEYTMTLPTHGSRTFSSPVIAGSYQALTTIGGSVSGTILTELQTTIAETQSKLESNDPTQLATINREAILGDMFYAGSLGYFAQYTALTHVAGLQQGAHQDLLPSIGTYGYVPKVNYLFGLPRAIEPGGIEMDLDNISTFTGTNQNDRTQLINFVQQTGTLSSALEHAVPEQMFTTDPQSPPEAISAVKALNIANAQGQRIYEITPANQATVLANIHHDNATMDEIRASLTVGKTVITHTDAVSVIGYVGAGYIIFDPETGEGAYKISGGSNGSETDATDAMGYLAKTFFYVFGFKGNLAAQLSGNTNTLQSVQRFAALAGFVLGIFDIAANCPTDNVSYLILAYTVLTIIFLATLLALTALGFGPLAVFFAGVVLSQGLALLKDGLINSPFCKP